MIPGWEGRDEEGWARVLGVPRLELHRELSSTNRRLRGASLSFTTVVAHAQLEGRGREGRRWRSPAGGGLWISVLLPLPPGGPPGVAPLAVGVATAEAVEAVMAEMEEGEGRGGMREREVRLGLKWPNDLLVVGPGDRDVAKLAGILCEATSGGIVAGIGVNLRTEVAGATTDGGAEADAGFPAIGLDALTGRPVPPSALAVPLLAALRRWADPPPDGLEGALREAWESRDLLRGTRVQVTSGTREEGRGGPRGRVRGVGVEGSLLVEDEAGGVPVAVRAGHVRWI